MKSGLYRIEVTFEMENAEPGTAMIICNRGTCFANIRPVNVKARTTSGCEYCNVLNVRKVAPLGKYDGLGIKEAKYCFNCGRLLKPEKTEG